jgi:hypothetical protein
VHPSRFVGRLHQRAEHAVAELGLRHHLVRRQQNLDPERLRPRAKDVERLRKTGVGHQELRRAHTPLNPLRLHPRQHGHRLGGGGRFVEQRCIGDLHPRQVGHHRLKIEERFEAPLRDLGLIGRVGRVPTRVLEDVAENDARCDRVVVAVADERAGDLIARRDRAELLEEVVLALALREVQRRLEPDARRDRFVHQRVERRRADGLEHVGRFFRVWSDVAGLERFEVKNHVMADS